MVLTQDKIESVKRPSAKKGVLRVISEVDGQLQRQGLGNMR